MNLKKALFNIFGPVIIAGLVVFAILAMPTSSSHFSQKTLYRASLSQSKNIFKGTIVKQQAFEENYVPFFGSSEYSRLDAFHPSVLAKHYHRPYQPFLLGAPGSQSLAQYFGMQGVNKQLYGKKAVMVVSPQWFVKKGIDPLAFAQYYSNLEAVTWLLHAKNNYIDRFAAQRLLQMPSARSDFLIKNALMTVASGQKLSKWQHTYLNFKFNQLTHEDHWFSTLAMNNRIGKVNHVSAELPKSVYNAAKLDKVAYKLGSEQANNNPFDIYNKFWNHRLKGNYVRLHNEQVKFDYVESPEFADFELLLNQFKQNHMNVMFVIPPVNKKWMEFTGLRQSMLDEFNRKITYQLRSQGFNSIVNLSQDGGEQYFMQDTIHLGWRGWLKMDEQVDPFLTKPQPQPTYHLRHYFFSQKWQKMHGQQLTDYLAEQEND